MTKTKNTLFDDESDEEIAIKTENEYAKKYDVWRGKEELHKLEQKYGSKSLNSDESTDSEDESDEIPEVSEEMEKQFLKTLALLKKKDPRIYDPNYKFFNDKLEKEKEKPVETKQPTFDDSDSDDSNDGNIFKIEKKASDMLITENEQKTEVKKEEKLKDFLTGKVDDIDDEEIKDLEPLKALWSDPKLNEGEAFLRDYILNKRYLEEGDAGEADTKIRDDEELEADEATVEEQGKFERAYNFRFEEPDEEYLKRFPRTMNSIRPKDDKRARKRAEIRTRKEEEKKRKMEEIARLKSLKLKEIQEKIAKIKEVTGNQDLAFKEEDIEGDFDPEEHDRRMQAIFDEEYYGDVDNEKPIFPELDEELEIENWDSYEIEENLEQNYQNNDGPHCEDAEFNMDADYDPKQARIDLIEEFKQNQGKKRRNRKRKTKLGEILEQAKPKYVPTVADKTYDEYMEEYYKMDCEDVIGGDLPTRFKYRQVVPNDYGLSIEEILLADDKELTQWVPLKKIVKHRPEAVEKSEVKTYAQKAADERLKKKILPSLFKDLPEEPEIVVPIDESTKKKKKKRDKADNPETNPELEDNINSVTSNDDKANADVEDNTQKVGKKKRKHKQKNKEKETAEANSSELTSEITNKQTDEKELSNEHTNEKVLSNTNKKEKKQLNKINGFIVEEVKTDAYKEKESHDKTIKNINIVNNLDQEKKATKHKLEANKEEHTPKKKQKKNNKSLQKTQFKNKKRPFGKSFKSKDKFKSKRNKEKSTNDPLAKLSDERLKAYGLNPKKYRSFLKYKKF